MGGCCSKEATGLCQLPRSLVGLTRFELVTSPLSGVRSNQLSYRPKSGDKIPDRSSGVKDRLGSGHCSGYSDDFAFLDVKHVGQWKKSVLARYTAHGRFGDCRRLSSLKETTL